MLICHDFRSFILSYVVSLKDFWLISIAFIQVYIDSLLIIVEINLIS
jgi:hypothetical protein